MANERAQKPDALDLRGRVGLTVQETAQALGISVRHVRAHLANIPHCHVGSRVVVPVDALRRWLDELAETERSALDTAVDDILGSLEGEP